MTFEHLLGALGASHSVGSTDTGLKRTHLSVVPDPVEIAP